MTIHCWPTSRPVPAIWARIGKWIPYTATQVAARRLARRALFASRLICVVVPTVVGGGAVAGILALPQRPAHTTDAPAPLPPLAWHPSDPVPRPVPEPSSMLMLATAVWAFWRVRR